MSKPNRKAESSKAPTFQYDSDDGLRLEIERITAVPSGPGRKRILVGDDEAPEKWKSNNATYCVACKEGGELLCCDMCPASFHLSCHEPPLSQEDLPSGKWMCNRCTRTPANQRCEKKKAGEHGESERNKAAIRRVFRENEQKASVGDPTTGHLDPLSLLAKTALAVNPEAYELPEEIGGSRTSLPYDELRKSRNVVKNGFCAYCQRFGRESVPMLSCDFCPLVWHLDCLDPPLAAPPKDKWMCPDHVEHLVDRCLLDSVSLTRRMELWDRYAQQPIDPAIVERSFSTTVREKERSLPAPPPMKKRRKERNSTLRDLCLVASSLSQSDTSYTSSCCLAPSTSGRQLSTKRNDVPINQKFEPMEVESNAIRDSIVSSLVATIFNTHEVKRNNSLSANEPQSDTKLITSNECHGLIDMCMARFACSSDPRDRVIFQLAAERLKQISKDVAVIGRRAGQPLKPVSLEQQLVEYNQHRESRKVDSEETANREREKRNDESPGRISWWERAWPKEEHSTPSRPDAKREAKIERRGASTGRGAGRGGGRGGRGGRGASGGRGIRGGRGRARGRPANASNRTIRETPSTGESTQRHGDENQRLDELDELNELNEPIASGNAPGSGRSNPGGSNEPTATSNRRGRGCRGRGGMRGRPKARAAHTPISNPFNNPSAASPFPFDPSNPSNPSHPPPPPPRRAGRPRHATTSSTVSLNAPIFSDHSTPKRPLKVPDFKSILSTLRQIPKFLTEKEFAHFRELDQSNLALLPQRHFSEVELARLVRNQLLAQMRVAQLTEPTTLANAFLLCHLSAAKRLPSSVLAQPAPPNSPPSPTFNIVTGISERTKLPQNLSFPGAASILHDHIYGSTARTTIPFGNANGEGTGRSRASTHAQPPPLRDEHLQAKASQGKAESVSINQSAVSQTKPIDFETQSEKGVEPVEQEAIPMEIALPVIKEPSPEPMSTEERIAEQGVAAERDQEPPDEETIVVADQEDFDGIVTEILGELKEKIVRSEEEEIRKINDEDEKMKIQDEILDSVLEEVVRKAREHQRSELMSNVVDEVIQKVLAETLQRSKEPQQIVNDQPSFTVLVPTDSHSRREERAERERRRRAEKRKRIQIERMHIEQANTPIARPELRRRLVHTQGEPNSIGRWLACPYDPRHFDENLPLLAVIHSDFGSTKPFAVQRELTMLGTNGDCHIQLDEMVDDFCYGIAQRHADIVFDTAKYRFEMRVAADERIFLNGICYGGAETEASQCICALPEKRELKPLGRRVWLSDGDWIRIGCALFLFRSRYTS